VTTVVSGLDAPWSMVRLESGSTLVRERDTSVVKELLADGKVRDVGTVPGVSASGEGGLLGLEFADGWVFAYFTAASDNRIMRFALEGDAGSYILGASEDVLTGLAKAGNHNGGRIKLGPDGMLYATVGDASNPSSAQEVSSYNGKILRMQLDGACPKTTRSPGRSSTRWDTATRRVSRGTRPCACGPPSSASTPGTRSTSSRQTATNGWPIVEGIGGERPLGRPGPQGQSRRLALGCG